MYNQVKALKKLGYRWYSNANAYVKHRCCAIEYTIYQSPSTNEWVSNLKLNCFVTEKQDIIKISQHYSQLQKDLSLVKAAGESPLHT